MGMEVGPFAQIQAQAENAQLNDISTFAGTSEAIVELMMHDPVAPELSIDLNALDMFTVDAKTDQFLLLSTETSRLAVDAITGVVLGMEAISGQ